MNYSKKMDVVRKRNCSLAVQHHNAQRIIDEFEIGAEGTAYAVDLDGNIDVWADKLRVLDIDHEEIKLISNDKEKRTK